MKHQFAIYRDSFSSGSGLLKPGSPITLNDPDLAHRLQSVLRLERADQFILFDRAMHVLMTIQELDKKKVVLSVHSSSANVVLEPAITVFLPLLRREAFEEAVYSAVELGATVIQSIMTAKVQRSWGGAKEKERMHRIMIAAAEQSKNFSFPLFHDPVALPQALEAITSIQHKIFFDPAGQPLMQILTAVYEKQQTELMCMIGPEGDLSEDEKALLKKNNVQFYALTPTVLRAQQALAVGLGALRLVSSGRTP